MIDQITLQYDLSIMQKLVWMFCNLKSGLQKYENLLVINSKRDKNAVCCF